MLSSPLSCLICVNWVPIMTTYFINVQKADGTLRTWANLCWSHARRSCNLLDLYWWGSEWCALTSLKRNRTLNDASLRGYIQSWVTCLCWCFDLGCWKICLPPVFFLFTYAVISDEESLHYGREGSWICEGIALESWDSFSFVLLCLTIKYGVIR